MTARARGVLWTLQATLVALPLFLGGRQPFGLLAAWTAMAVLLVLTLRARRSVSRPVVPGAAALAAVVALGLFTALPLLAHAAERTPAPAFPVDDADPEHSVPPPAAADIRN